MQIRLVAIYMLTLVGFTSTNAADFATKRLQSIAQCLSLPQLDTLHNESSYSYLFKNRKLVVRVNRYGEVEHIGLALFPQEMTRLSPSPVYDFLERNLLERQLTNYDGELKHRLASEHLTFVTGNAATPLSFNGTEEFTEEHVDLKRYRVTWSRNGKEILIISFDMDIELLSGCNAIELEERFLHRLKRQQLIDMPDEVGIFPENAKSYIVQGDTFLIKEMRNDLFYEKGGKGWHLSDHADMPSKTLPNMMLSNQFPKDLSLQLTVDKYGYETEKLTVPYKNLLNMTAEDGCTPYFGIKGREEDGTYTGVLMLVNRRGGYIHMLSVVIPATTISSKDGNTLSGRLYVYIPMHNVSDRFFQKKKNSKNKKR